MYQQVRSARQYCVAFVPDLRWDSKTGVRRCNRSEALILERSTILCLLHRPCMNDVLIGDFMMFECDNGETLLKQGKRMNIESPNSRP
jgi:hypothetical protein